jgi:hypothetical protein
MSAEYVSNVIAIHYATKIQILMLYCENLDSLISSAVFINQLLFG